MRRLADLEPSWIVRNGQPEGLLFCCPVCEGNDAGHALGVTWVPPSLHTSGAVWRKTGSTFDDLTISPSIDATRGGACKFHGFITNGIVTWI